MTTLRSSFLAACALGLASATVASAQAVVAIQLTGTTWAAAAGALGNNGLVLSGSNIQPAADYTGPNFRGGAVFTNASVTNWQVANNLSSTGILNGLDTIRLNVGSFTPSGTASHNALVFFDQSSFGNGLNNSVGGVTLNSSTSFTFSAKRVGGSTTQIGYVIQANGSYFIHKIAYNDNQAGAGGQGHVFALSDPTSVSWSSFTPTSSLSTIGGTASPDFTKVTGIGIWFENQRTTTGALDMRIGEITLNATAVPEPSAFAALAGLGALGFAASRRRRA